ncbi:hypothetical protein JKA74_05580 [Marivirga sp. S37H4]|uniref:Uncharacterized protein n=1 Tax=Marivirga aurantiaca TaxID=2802615 RepID=A0A934WX24_9BACT|nr:hypothetical protein [Marivirga aurantiaca]MBK6264501.1 hypothetical protein [Marivirga aurantiaca]
MGKYILGTLLLVLIAILLPVTSSYAQVQPCNEEFSYQIGQDELGETLLVEKTSNKKYKYKLFAISTETRLIEELEDNIMNDKILFSGLKQDEIYLVQISGDDGCLFTLGGMEGIKIDN